MYIKIYLKKNAIKITLWSTECNWIVHEGSNEPTNNPFLIFIKPIAAKLLETGPGGRRSTQ